MFSCLFINPANRVPGVQTGHVPGSLVPIDLYWDKLLKIFFSETMRPRFSMYQCLVVSYIISTNHAAWVKIANALWVIYQYRAV